MGEDCDLHEVGECEFPEEADTCAFTVASLMNSRADFGVIARMQRRGVK